MILRFIGGMALVALGVFLVIKSEWMLQNFGTIAWAEEHLGYDGGSRLFYKLLGIIFCLLGFAIAFGLFGGSFAQGLAPYFGGPQAPR
jgi:hypothetical protein